MKFTETNLSDAFIVDIEPHVDRRGFFSRAFCAKEFQDHGLKPAMAQCNLSLNYNKGTLRGLHYQVPPAAEAKLFRCIQGSNYHVIVDMRSESSTYLQHFGVELSAQNRRALYIPELFAHGYQALVDGSEALYQVSEFYTPGCERGIRYDDPTFGIEWPLAVSEISEKDASWPLFQPTTAGVHA